MDEKFYSPLSAKGYLTPLQRKKLREKRALLPSLEAKDIQNGKIPPVVKRKREINICLPSKREKRTKHKDPMSKIQCSAAQIISKTNSSTKEKKFFKTSSPSRLEKANFSMPFVYKKNLFSVINRNIKENNFLLKKQHNFKEHRLNVQVSRNDSGNEDKMNAGPCIIKITNNFSDIGEVSLQTGQTNEMPEQETVKPLFDFDWPSDEILLKRQEEARASTKRQKVLNENVENNEEEQTIDEPVQKLYPIFYIASRKQTKDQQDNKRKQKSGSKKLKESSNGGEQMMIDAGQKEFGAKICSTCKMIYSVAVEEDERLHLNYHNMYLINLKFPGWKEENVIAEYTDGRIIIVRKNEQSFKIKKIEDVLEIANRDLGFSTSSLPSKPDLTFLLFISNSKQVAGCVVAEPISQASRVLLAEDNKSTPLLPSDEKETTWRIGNWYSSSETFPAVCGVNRIWVAHNYRRSLVASRMIDCLRCHFVHGHVVSIRELAFTDPSPDGREFAASYTGTDNFLVYR